MFEVFCLSIFILSAICLESFRKLSGLLLSLQTFFLALDIGQRSRSQLPKFNMAAESAEIPQIIPSVFTDMHQEWLLS
jgi:hypothetical protein